jgi:hypothetical protein
MRFFKPVPPEDAADLLDELQDAHQALVEKHDKLHTACLEAHNIAMRALTSPLGDGVEQSEALLRVMNVTLYAMFESRGENGPTDWETAA